MAGQPVPFEKRIENAKAEATGQIESGLIQGAVFAVGNEGPIVSLGRQTVHPTETPMSAKSRFDMASAGKTFIAGCVAHLVVDGLIDPDAPFVKYLPEHGLAPRCDITVRDLAMHVGGFMNDKPYDSPDMEIFRQGIMGKKPVRPRLEAFEYACSNFIMLGMIVERVTGKRLDVFARERIWAPLGMVDTCWDPPGPGPHEVEHWDPNRPAGEHNDNVCHNCPFPIGSGSCFSTVPDMLLFLNDIIERKHFAKEYYDLITTCAYEKNGARRSFGWDMGEDHRPRNVSDKAIFHSGYTGQSILADPGTGFRAAVLTSRVGNWMEAYAGRVRILEALK